MRELKEKIKRQLLTLYSAPEAEHLARTLMAKAFEVPYPMLVVAYPKVTSFTGHEERLKIIDEWLQRLLDHEPWQYIEGTCEFFSMSLHVAPGVLIPRPETEYLCKLIEDQAKSLKISHAADLCTGSGCIALALATICPNAVIEAVDISPEALAIARQNVAEQGFDHRISVRQDDLLDPSFSPGFDRYDLVVSNPPYILPGEKPDMEKRVTGHEPGSALFVTEGEPLIFYEKILHHYAPRLKQGGMIFFEINPLLSAELQVMAQQYVDNVEMLTDQFGRIRFLQGKK